MGKIIVSEFLTLDGIMDAPDKWQIKYTNDEMANDIEEELCKADILLYGRTTYLTMAGAWPSRTGTIAYKFNNLPKYVVSTTMKKAEWNNSTIIGENISEEITKLKQLPGKRILIWGSKLLVHSLQKCGLIDEYRLYIHPVILGSGDRLFGDNAQLQEMELTNSKIFNTGTFAGTYKFKKQNE